MRDRCGPVSVFLRIHHDLPHLLRPVATLTWEAHGVEAGAQVGLCLSRATTHRRSPRFLPAAELG
jgi:hypothetical protein